MSHALTTQTFAPGTFSTRCVPVIPCPVPVLTIGFPTKCPPSQRVVVLANGACVDLVELGQIIAKFCPGFAPDAGVTVGPLSAEALQQIRSQLQPLGIDATQVGALLQQVGVQTQPAGVAAPLLTGLPVGVMGTVEG